MIAVTPAEAFDVVARCCDELDLSPAGQPIASGLDPRLERFFAEHRHAVVWGIVGWRSGHRYRSCSDCGAVALLAKNRKCFMAKGCKGQMIDATKIAVDEAPPCARPGCNRPALLLGLCRSDLVLAQELERTIPHA